MSYSTVITKEEAAEQLGITDISDLKLIRAAYRRMALLYHPDVATRSEKASHETFTEKAKLFEILLANDETDWESDQADMLAEARAMKEWAESSEEENHEIIKRNKEKEEKDMPVLATLEELLKTNQIALADDADTLTVEDNNAILAQLLGISYTPSPTPDRRSEPKIASPTANAFPTGARGAGASSVKSRQHDRTTTPKTPGNSVRKELFPSSGKPSPKQSTRRELEALVQEIEAHRGEVFTRASPQNRTLEALLLDVPLMRKTPAKPATPSPLTATAAYSAAGAPPSAPHGEEAHVLAASAPPPPTASEVHEPATGAPPAAAPLGKPAAPTPAMTLPSTSSEPIDELYTSLNYQLLESIIFHTTDKIDKAWFDIFFRSANKAAAIRGAFQELKRAIIRELRKGVDSPEFKAKLLTVLSTEINNTTPISSATSSSITLSTEAQKLPTPQEAAQNLKAALSNHRFIQRQTTKTLFAISRVTNTLDKKYMDLNRAINQEIERLKSWRMLFSISSSVKANDISSTYQTLKRKIAGSEIFSTPEHQKQLIEIVEYMMCRKGAVPSKYEKFAQEARNLYLAIDRQRSFSKSSTTQAISATLFANTTPPAIEPEPAAAASA